MKAHYLTAAVGLALVVPAWIGCFSNGVPTLICPMPTLTVLPEFSLAFLVDRYSLPLSWVVILPAFVPTLFFFSWNPGLFRGNSRIPRRSPVLLAILTVMSVIYFAASWKYGNEYQGHHHTLAICALNVLWIAMLCVILRRSLRLCSFGSNLLFHAALFAWLAWYAFPYLGELP